MKTLKDLNSVDFLRKCNQIRKQVQEVLDNTKVLKIREHKPELTGKETPEEVKALYDAQTKKNINDMLDLMLEEKPEETVKLFRMLIDLDEGEEYPEGLDLILIGFETITDEKVLNFLSRLMQSGLMNT